MFIHAKVLMLFRTCRMVCTTYIISTPYMYRNEEYRRPSHLCYACVAFKYIGRCVMTHRPVTSKTKTIFYLAGPWKWLLRPCPASSVQRCHVFVCLSIYVSMCLSILLSFCLSVLRAVQVSLHMRAGIFDVNTINIP